jgi:protein-S-isoprenylcysteine O-methyltransferase Ste14
MSVALPEMFCNPAYPSWFPLGAEAPGGGLFGFDLQPAFVSSLLRLGLMLLCSGMVWLLSQSSLLTERKRNAAIVGGLIYVLAATTAELILTHLGISRYVFANYVYQGVPLDVELCYAAVWGTGLCLMWESAWPLIRPLLFLSAVALASVFDQWGLRTGNLLAAPAANWIYYDVGLHTLLPGLALYFYYLVDENRGLTLRCVTYALGYFLLFYFLLPSLILSVTQTEWSLSVERWRWVILAMAVSAVPGGWAAGQYAVSGRGTPLPLDPTSRLIVTGPYAFVRNPMQLSFALMAVTWAVASLSIYLAIYAVVLVAGMQYMRNLEEDDLHRRFGNRYKNYARRVRLWIPHTTPYEED